MLWGLFEGGDLEPPALADPLEACLVCVWGGGGVGLASRPPPALMFSSLVPGLRGEEGAD